MFQPQRFEEDWPITTGQPLLVPQVDGGMVSIVIVEEMQADRCCGKRLEWRSGR